MKPLYIKIRDDVLHMIYNKSWDRINIDIIAYVQANMRVHSTVGREWEHIWDYVREQYLGK